MSGEVKTSGVPITLLSDQQVSAREPLGHDKTHYKEHVEHPKHAVPFKSVSLSMQGGMMEPVLIPHCIFFLFFAGKFSQPGVNPPPPLKKKESISRGHE